MTGIFACQFGLNCQRGGSKGGRAAGQRLGGLPSRPAEQPVCDLLGSRLFDEFLFAEFI